MKLSVVIPCCNAERFVEQSIASCLANDFSACDCEIICVDDCSRDGTLKVLEELAAGNPRLVVLRHEQNKGANEARRTGVLAATGDYILFCDADDSFEAHALDRIAGQLAIEPVEVLFFGHKCIGDGELLEEKRWFYETDSRYAGPATQDAIMAAMFVRPPELLWHVWGRAWARDVVIKGFGLLPQIWGCRCEDGCESLAFLIFAHKFGFLRQELYRYKLDTGITNTKEPTEDNVNTVLRSADFVFEFCGNLNLLSGGRYARFAAALKESSFDDFREIVIAYLLPNGKQLSLNRLETLGGGKLPKAITFLFAKLFNERTKVLTAFNEDAKLSKKYARYLRFRMDIDMFFTRNPRRKAAIKRMRDSLKSLYPH